MSDLKACPFCGGDGTFSHALAFGNVYVPYIECGECSASSCTFDTKQEAVTAWNSRVPDIATVTAILIEGKLSEMTISMFKPKYEKLLAFVKELKHTYRDDCNYSAEAEELLKEIGESR